MLKAYDLVMQKIGIRLEPVNWRVLRRAAELRSLRPALRTLDAIHAATADLVVCDAFVTNDKSLQGAGVPNMIILDDLP